MTKTFWDSMSIEGESVRVRQAAKGNSVDCIQPENNSVHGINAEGSFEMSHYNEPQSQRFNWKKDYKGKDGKGSLESVQNDKDMYLAGDEHNRS